MKKMLMLILVLGVASLAVAAPVWTITGSAPGTIAANVTGNPGDSMYLAMVVDSGGVLSSFAMGANAPLSSQWVINFEDAYSEMGLQGEIWTMIDITTGDPVYDDGEWLTANFAFAEGSPSATVYLYDAPEGDLTLLTSHTFYIPEPMTMTLLGLGGLFLRRRK